MQSAGDDLISIDAGDPAAAQALAMHLRTVGGWTEVVAGIDSVVVRFDAATSNRADVEGKLDSIIAEAPLRLELPDKELEIPVAYGGKNGPDLEHVCERLGLTAPEFIELHTGVYTVDMLGFIPGFAYIGGLPRQLSVDRLPEPRQHVPAGSVGVAGGRTGLYSLPGPGGWPLVGRTAMRLFDASAEDPFLLQPGMTVRFRAVGKL